MPIRGKMVCLLSQSEVSKIKNNLNSITTLVIGRLGANIRKRSLWMFGSRPSFRSQNGLHRIGIGAGDIEERTLDEPRWLWRSTF